MQAMRNNSFLDEAFLFHQIFFCFIWSIIYLVGLFYTHMGTLKLSVLKVEDEDDIETVRASISGGEVKEEKPTQHEARSEPRPQKTGFKRISPSAKLLITEHGLDASSITASGPRGTLLKGDVLGAIKSGKASPKTSFKDQSPRMHPQTSLPASPESKSHLKQADSYEDLPNSQIRKVTWIKW